MSIDRGFGIATSSVLADSYDLDALISNTEVAKVAAQAAQAASELALDTFDDRYLGAKASDPTVDNDGDALIDGAMYFDTALNITKIYDLATTAWKRTTPTTADQTNIDTVSAKATEIGRLGTVDAVADMAILGTADVVTDMNTLGTADVVTDMNTLGTADVVLDMNTLGTAGNVTNMDTLAGISANITTVAGISADTTTVAGIATNVTSVAGNATNINSAVSNAADITTVATNIADVNTVGGISADVTTVAGIDANVTTVAGVSANVTTVAGISSDVTAVAADATDIGVVAAADTNIGLVGGSITNVNEVANNIGSVNAFSEQYRVSATAPTTSLDAGDLWFDTTAGTMKVYDGSGFVNAGSSVNGVDNSVEYTATAGQTSFAATYDAGYLNVFLNGVKLDSTDYTATNGSTVVLDTGAALNDSVFIQSFGTFELADHYSKTASDARFEPIDSAYTKAEDDARFLGLAGGTMTGTIAGFTSTGIDDNATSTAITIDASENVGIGSSIEAHNSGMHSIQHGFGGNIGSWKSNNSVYYVCNSYYGNTWKAINSGAACKYEQRNDGIHDFQVAASVAADAANSWVTGFEILNDGKARAKNGLLFGTDTAAANALDDYEQGTWTPTLSTGTHTYTTQSGTYTKIGRVVTLTGEINISARGGSTSELGIGGLPFSASFAQASFDWTSAYSVSGLFSSGVKPNGASTEGLIAYLRLGEATHASYTINSLNTSGSVRFAITYIA